MSATVITRIVCDVEECTAALESIGEDIDVARVTAQRVGWDNVLGESFSDDKDLCPAHATGVEVGGSR